MAKRAGRDSKMGIKKKNYQQSIVREVDKVDTLDTPLFRKKIAKNQSTILSKNTSFLMRECPLFCFILFAYSGHRIYVKCSLILFSNSIISIFESFPCVKSVFKIKQIIKIKNFYWNRGMSTLSTMSSIIFTVIQYSFIYFIR